MTSRVTVVGDDRGMHIQADRIRIPAGLASERFLQITVHAPGARAESARPPVDVALVLDRSGSMGGRKFAMARAAVEHAIRLLRPTDRLAVVCYDDRVDTVLPCTAATADAKRQAMQQLALIDPRGSTNLEGGWTRGVEELLRVPTTTTLDHASPRVRRVLLLTDGLANVGLIEAGALTALALERRAQGVVTSTFGVGADFDEDLLSAIATQGGGHFYFVEQAEQIPDLLTSELGETLQVVAHDVVFEVAHQPVARERVGCRLLNRLPHDTTRGRLRVSLGDLVADQELTLLVALDVPAVTTGKGVSVACRLADRDGVFAPHPMTVDFLAAPADAHGAQPVNLEVLRAVARMLADEARRLALQANRRREYDEVPRLMREAAASIRALAPGDVEIEAVADGLRGETTVLYQAMSPMEQKRRHFASYAASMSRDVSGKARRRPPVAS